MTKRTYPIVLPNEANYIATDGKIGHITEIDPPSDVSKTLMKFNEVTGEYEIVQARK